MLAYTALRLAAIEALTGATIAGDRVYDSRQFPLDAVDASLLDAGPSLCVYTEEGDGAPYGSGRINPSDTHVWLVIEVVVVAAGAFQVMMPDGSVTMTEGGTVPITDRAHEGAVDVLAAQVRRRLSVDAALDQDAAAALFRSAHKGVIQSHDVPQRSADKAARLAGRTLRYRVHLSCDRWPATPGSGVLPEPLASIASGLTLSSSLALVETLTGYAPPSPTSVAVGPVEVSLVVGVGRDPDPTPDVTASAP